MCLAPLEASTAGLGAITMKTKTTARSVAAIGAWFGALSLLCTSCVRHGHGRMDPAALTILSTVQQARQWAITRGTQVSVVFDQNMMVVSRASSVGTTDVTRITLPEGYSFPSGNAPLTATFDLHGNLVSGPQVVIIRDGKNKERSISIAIPASGAEPCSHGDEQPASLPCSHVDDFEKRARRAIADMPVLSPFAEGC